MNNLANMRALRTARSGGFTLIELLMVLLIIALLLGMVTGGITFAVNNARIARDRTNRGTLFSALQNYRHEYGDWPGPEGAPSQGAVWYDDNNWQVFNPLHPAHRDNAKKIVFIEDGQFLTLDRNGDRINLATLRGGNPYLETPLVDPWGYPYKVTIDLDNDTVMVSPNDDTRRD